MMRIVVLLVLFFFSWASIEPWKIAVAQEKEQQPNSIPARQKQDSKEQRKSFEKADRSLQNIKRIVDKLKNKAKNGEFSQQGFLSEMTAFEQEASFLESQHADIRAEFNNIHDKIQAADLPTKIMKRHQKAVSNYNANYNKLKKYVDYIKQYKNNASQTANQSSINYEELKRNIEDMSAFLDENVKGKPHNPLNPNKLPHRPAEKVEPSVETMSKRDLEKFKNEHDPVLLAYNGDPANLQLAQVPSDLPTEEDLAENIEVQFTEGITSLAASLDNHPLNIFNWVRQNIRFVPTFGSIQGAEACRLSKECNAHDAASLLITLLRVSGVPARYVTGTIQIDADLFKSALGDFEDIRAAARLASSGGLTVTLLNDPSTGEVEAVKMNHVWVEAFVDYVPSRGAVKGEGDTWVPLDGVIKRMEFNVPIGFEENAGVDIDSFRSELAATGVIDDGGFSVSGISTTLANSRVTQFHDNLENYIRNEIPDNTTVGDLLGASEIQVADLKVLPASLPTRVINQNRNSSLTSTDRHNLTIQVLDGSTLLEDFRFETSTAEVAGKRIILNYVAATDADSETIDSFGGLYNAPPNLINVRPVINVENENVVIGSAFGMGDELIIKVNFREPDGTNDRVEHHIEVGTFAAFGLDLQRVSDTLLENRSNQLENTRSRIENGEEEIFFDDIMGEILHIHALSYFLQTESYNRVIANRLNVVATKRPAELLLFFSPVFSRTFGAAVDIVNSGLGIDFVRNVQAAESRTDNEDDRKSYFLTSGNYASVAENAVFEQLTETESVSAAKLIIEANRLGIKVFTIDQTNSSTIIPQLNLPSEVISDISNSVNSGNQVIVPQQEISFMDWFGVGYVVLEPDSGAGAYLISGGLSGGFTAALSDFINFLDQLIANGNWKNPIDVPTGASVGLDIIGLVIGLSPFLTIPIAAILLTVSVFLTYSYVYDETGSVVDSLSAAGIAGLIGAYLIAVTFAIGTVVTSTALAVGTILLSTLILAFLTIQLIDLIIVLSSSFLQMLRKIYWISFQPRSYQNISLRSLFSTGAKV